MFFFHGVRFMWSTLSAQHRCTETWFNMSVFLSLRVYVCMWPVSALLFSCCSSIYLRCITNFPSTYDFFFVIVRVCMAVWPVWCSILTEYLFFLFLSLSHSLLPFIPLIAAIGVAIDADTHCHPHRNRTEMNWIESNRIGIDHNDTDMGHRTLCWSWAVSRLVHIVRDNLTSAIGKTVAYRAPTIRACIHGMSHVIGPFDRNRCQHANMQWLR